MKPRSAKLARTDPCLVKLDRNYEPRRSIMSYTLITAVQQQLSHREGGNLCRGIVSGTPYINLFERRELGLEVS